MLLVNRFDFLFLSLFLSFFFSVVVSVCSVLFLSILFISPYSFFLSAFSFFLSVVRPHQH